MNFNNVSARTPQFGARYSTGQKAQTVAGAATLAGGVSLSAGVLADTPRGGGGDPFMGAMHDTNNSTVMTGLMGPFMTGSAVIGQAAELAEKREKVKDPEATVLTPEDRIQQLQDKLAAEQQAKAALDAKATTFIQTGLNRKFGAFSLTQIMNALFAKQPIVNHDTLDEKSKELPEINNIIEKSVAEVPKETGLLGRFRYNRKVNQVRDEANRQLLAGLAYLESSGLAAASHRHDLGFRFTTLTELGVSVKKQLPVSSPTVVEKSESAY